MSCKKILGNLSLVCVGILLPLFVLEGYYRVQHWRLLDRPLLANPNEEWDETLGWKGEIHQLGPKDGDTILVLGDSFTHGITVKSENMWFGSLSHALPNKQIIAYGGLGFGTLQELIVLRRYLNDGLNPSTIIIQICTNDIINNSFELEKRTYMQRAPAPRPYLENGKVHYKFPREYGEILLPLISYSLFFHVYNVKWETMLAQRAQEGEIDSVEFKIEKQGFAFPLYREAVNTTEKLFRRIKNKAGHSKVILVLVNDIEPYSTSIKDIANKHDLPLIIPTRIAAIPLSGFLPDGAHYNEEGNKIIGDAFVNAAFERDLLPSPTRKPPTPFVAKLR